MAHPKVGLRKRDTGWVEFFKRAASVARAGKVKVGFLDGGPGAETHPGSDLTIAQIAAILEFGTEDGTIPERSILRATFDKRRKDVEEMAAKLVGQVLDGKITDQQALGLLGAWFAAEVKKYVTAGAHVQPENAPSTIAQKGSDRPWVDTGRTINSVSWATEGRGMKKHG